MVYSYYDYLENYYESYYEYYYAYQYWPSYYNHSNGTNTTYNGTYPPSPYEYHAPYNMDHLTPPTYTLIILCAVLSVIIALITVYKIYTAKRRNKVTTGLVLCCIFLHLAQNIIDPISYYLWYLNYDSSSTIAWEMNMIWDIIWCLAKLSLYSLFIYRYWLVFKSTPASGKREAYIVFGGFTAAMLTQCGLYIAYLIHQYVAMSQRIYLNVCWAFLAIDTILLCILGFLLCRSLLRLVIMIRRLNPNHKIEAFHIASPTVTVTKTTCPSKKSDANTTDTYTAYESGFMNRNQIKQSVTNDSGYLDGARQLRINSVSVDVQLSAAVVASKTTQEPSVVAQTVISSAEQKKAHSQSNAPQEKRLNHLLHTATLIAVTTIVSMISSFVYQLVWLIAEELEHHVMLWFSYTWCVDAVINMLCVYLSMSFANKHYKWLCSGVCKLHQCILGCVQKVVDIYAK
eukprot:29563_1